MGIFIVLIVLALVLGFFYEVELLPLGKTLNYDAFLTLMLTALGVMVALFTIFVGLAAIWGYAGFRDIVRDMAKREVAKAVTEKIKKYPDEARMFSILNRLEAQGELLDEAQNRIAESQPAPKVVETASIHQVQQTQGDAGAAPTPLDDIQQQVTPIEEYPGETKDKTNDSSDSGKGGGNSDPRSDNR